MISDVSLERLKQFEKIIKQCIINRYGKYIPAEKLAFFKDTSFIDKDMFKADDPKNKIQGDVIRAVLAGVIDVKCQKMLDVEDESTFILYGEYLEEGLIEYYTRKISVDYNLDITERPDLQDNLDLIIELHKKLGDGLDPMVFKSNAMEILDNAELRDLIEKCDVEAITAFVNKKKGVENLGVGSAAEEKQIKEDFGLDGRISIVYLHGKQYIKYIDKFDEVHLVETRDSGIVSEVYKERFKNLKPGEKIDPDLFFEELTKLVSETELKEEDEINRDQLTSEEVNMVDFVYGNKELKENVEADVVTHNAEAGIHVVEDTNEIVTTEDHQTFIDAVSVGGPNTGVNPDGTQVTGQEHEILSDEDNDLDANGDGVLDEEDLRILTGANPDDVEVVPPEGEAETNPADETGKSDEEHDPMILVDESTRILSYEEYEALCKRYANNETLTLEELKALKRSTPELMAMRQKQMEEEAARQKALEEQQRQQELAQQGPKLVLRGGDYGFTNRYLVIFVIVLTICIGVIIGALLFKLTH